MDYRTILLINFPPLLKKKNTIMDIMDCALSDMKKASLILTSDSLLTDSHS